jgi:hypothetical protein
MWRVLEFFLFFKLFFFKCIIWLFVSKLYLIWSLKGLQGKYLSLCSKGFVYYKWNHRLFVLLISLFSKLNICLLHCKWEFHFLLLFNFLLINLKYYQVALTIPNVGHVLVYHVNALLLKWCWFVHFEISIWLWIDFAMSIMRRKFHIWHLVWLAFYMLWLCGWGYRW